MPISITDLLDRYGSKVNTTLPTPTYQPVDVDVNVLRAHQANLQKIADDPLADAGVQNTLAGVRTALTANQNSALAAAKGRATRTGQAGFMGALAGAGQRALADRATNFSQAQSQLAAATATNARNQMSDVAKAILNAQLQGEQIATQRGSIDQARALAELQARLEEQRRLLDAAVTGRGQDVNAETVNTQRALEEKRLAQQREDNAARLDLERKRADLDNELRRAELDRYKKQQNPLQQQLSQAQAQLELLRTRKQMEALADRASQNEGRSGYAGDIGSTERYIDYRNPLNRSVSTGDGKDTGRTTNINTLLRRGTTR